ncbi:MAG TPA: PilZ domain-containing protein [Thermoanaerobaculia bacterium]
MLSVLPRDLRTAERFLLGPPVEGRFGKVPVDVSDISTKGARLRHDAPVEAGSKSVLTFEVDRLANPVYFEGVVVWTQNEPNRSPKFTSGVRIYAKPDAMDRVLGALRVTGRSNRIDELRASDRFKLTPPISGTFSPAGKAKIRDLSAGGAKVELYDLPELGTEGILEFSIEGLPMTFDFNAELIWSKSKTVHSATVARYVAGLKIDEKREHLRLAIAHLCQSGRATVDTHSLHLKLNIMRARARQQSAELGFAISGVPPEEFLLIEGVRAELRANPEEAAYWRTKASLSFAGTVELAERDAEEILAVWEYLDRSIDLAIVKRCITRS